MGDTDERDKQETPPVVAPPMAVAPDGSEQLINWKVWTKGPSIWLDGSATLKPLDPSWNDLRQPQIKFKFKVKKATARTKVEVLDGANVLFSKEVAAGDWITAGDHTFLWDGYTSGGVLDTAALRRGSLKAKVTTDDGSDDTSFSLKPEGVNWIDVKVDLGARTVEVKVNLSFQSTSFIKQIRNFDELKRKIREGVGKYWTRGISVGGTAYQVTTSAVEVPYNPPTVGLLPIERARVLSDSVTFSIVEQLPGGRSCNLATFGEAGNILFAYKNGMSENYIRETAAHEFGHSVLREAFSVARSLTHKGSSTAGQDRKPDSPHYPVAGEIDLMIYYFEEDHPLDFYARVIAAEEDTKGLVGIARSKVT